MTDLVALDIGGTHARFALATLNGREVTLAEPVTLSTSDYPSLDEAWDAFAAQCEGEVPRAAAIAIAGPVTGETVRMTNNSWVIHTGALDAQLKLDRVTVLNDFAAVAHAVARVPESDLLPVCGPEGPLPGEGTISVIGPGTGLGVAHFRRHGDGHYHVQATEGGHMDFAPVDLIDDEILRICRMGLGGRVSTERVNSGPGIVPIYAALAATSGAPTALEGDRAIWTAGLAGEDDLAAAAVDHFCKTLGSIAGDFALVHGASAVVLAGGLGYRLRDRLAGSDFAERFCAKGRYVSLMEAIPVRMITHPQPGLFGAAAAFQREHGL